MEHQQRVGAELLEGFGRDGCGDPGCPSRSPPTQEPNRSAGRLRDRGRGPRVPTAVHADRKRRSSSGSTGENLAQVIQHVAPLIRDGGLFDQDLAGPPEAFQGGAEFPRGDDPPKRPRIIPPRRCSSRRVNARCCSRTEIRLAPWDVRSAPVPPRRPEGCRRGPRRWHPAAAFSELIRPQAALRLRALRVLP